MKDERIQSAVYFDTIDTLDHPTETPSKGIAEGALALQCTKQDPFDPSWAWPCSSENQLKLQHPLDVLLLSDWRNVGGLNLASMKVARHGEKDVT